MLRHCISCIKWTLSTFLRDLVPSNATRRSEADQ
uniref:Uncharacterized protein n=1 Tax=Anguilla anguilla TaxID=7936 RepID=A0A0E9XK50_ANGAN